MSYDRYSQFRNGNSVGLVPFAEIPHNGSDRYEIYRKGQTRLDLLSYQYYDSPDYAWLIMQANPSAGAAEFEIPDATELRIPYPLSAALDGWQKGIEKHRKLYN